LRDSRIQSIGVEHDPALAEYLRGKKLPVVEQDLFGFLEAREPASLGGILAAQVIEHLDGESLFRLIRLCHSKLMTGGVLILESINPECLNVFTEALYLDPTHVRPYHPLGIQFLCQSIGFSEARVAYSSPLEESRPHLGGSRFQDFAVIARK